MQRRFSRVDVEWLPGYAAYLNWAEQIWSRSQYTDLANYIPEDIAELEKEVFKLEPGRLSGIIETRYGYHVVRVEEIMAPEQMSLEDVSEKNIYEFKENCFSEAVTRIMSMKRKVITI